VDLSEAERVVFEGHPSWRSTLGFYIKGALVAVVVGLVAALASQISEDEVKTTWIVVAVVVVLVVLLVAGWIKRIATDYMITTRRLHITRGVFARRTQEAQLARVQNVNTEQSVLERLLRVGNVNFDTAGTGDFDFSFVGVGDPHGVVAAVDQAQREAAEGAGGPPGR
jgi:uncharacterized membrane protein YdbT with pleckstrin-like domain